MTGPDNHERARDDAARGDDEQDRRAADGADAMDPPSDAPPLKRHGDALLDGSGSRQGESPPNTGGRGAPGGEDVESR